MKKIKFCKKNIKNGAKPVFQALQDNYGHIKLKKSSCLGHCRTCREECFVIIKSKIVKASSSEQLYKKIKKRIEAQK